MKLIFRISEDGSELSVSGVSLDEAAPGPTGIGCPQGRGMIDFF